MAKTIWLVFGNYLGFGAWDLVFFGYVLSAENNFLGT
jgi:hypothetical protein